MKEQRRSKRFQLVLPIQLVRAGSKKISLSGETRNVSSGGALFVVEDPKFDLGQAIEYYISFPPKAGQPQVRLRCLGKIVRRDEREGALAATLERYEFVR